MPEPGEIPRQDVGQPAPQDSGQSPSLETEKENIMATLLTREPSAEEKERIADLENSSNSIDFWVEYSDLDRLCTYKTREKAMGILREKLNGKILLDLGGGPASSLVKKLKKEGIRPEPYINVDRFPFEDVCLDRKTSQGLNYNESGSDICVGASLLDFLQYIEDGSVDAVAINGMDLNIIESIAYHEELVNQIKRVLRLGGIVFGAQSDAIWLIARDLVSSPTRRPVHPRDDFEIKIKDSDDTDPRVGDISTHMGAILEKVKN